MTVWAETWGISNRLTIGDHSVWFSHSIRKYDQHYFKSCPDNRGDKYKNPVGRPWKAASFHWSLQFVPVQCHQYGGQPEVGALIFSDKKAEPSQTPWMTCSRTCSGIREVSWIELQDFCAFFLVFLKFLFFYSYLFYYSCPNFPLCPPRPSPRHPAPTVNPHTVIHVPGSFIHALWLIPSPSSHHSPLPCFPLAAVSLFPVSISLVLFCCVSLLCSRKKEEGIPTLCDCMDFCALHLAPCIPGECTWQIKKVGWLSHREDVCTGELFSFQ